MKMCVSNGRQASSLSLCRKTHPLQSLQRTFLRSLIFFDAPLYRSFRSTLSEARERQR